MNYSCPFSRKEIFHIDNPSFWDDPAYQKGVELPAAARLTVIPVELDKEISLGEGNTLLKIGIKGMVEIRTAYAGYMTCVLDDAAMSSIPYAKKWKGRRYESSQMIELPAHPEFLFSFNPDVVAFAMLLCHNNEDYYLLVAPKRDEFKF